MEPEYRRRLRKRAKKLRQQHAAELRLIQERADEEARLRQERAAQPPKPKYWTRWRAELNSDRIALWVAAAVGAYAIHSSTSDSELARQEMVDQVKAMRDQAGKMGDQVKAMNDQATAMKQQLAEMQAEQRPNLWVTSNLGAPEYGAASQQVVWTVHLTNYGKNFVAKGTIHKFMLLGHGNFVTSYGEPANEQITPVAPGQEIIFSVISRPIVTADQLKTFLGITGGIQIKLVAEYEDLAGGHYRSTMCVLRTNAGSIAFCKESRIE
jgi:hypothetical protein